MVRIWSRVLERIHAKATGLGSEALSSTLLSCRNTWVCMCVHMGEHESIAVGSSVWSPGGSSPRTQQ